MVEELRDVGLCTGLPGSGDVQPSSMSHGAASREPTKLL